MGVYSQLDKFIKLDDNFESKLTSIVTEDSLIDTHGLFLLAYFVDVYLSKSNKPVVIISFKFRTFELESILSKSGIPVVKYIKSKKLSLIGSESATLNFINEIEHKSVLVIDSLSSIIEQSEGNNYQTSANLLNIILKAESKFTNLIIRTEKSSKIYQNQKIQSISNLEK